MHVFDKAHSSSTWNKVGVMLDAMVFDLRMAGVGASRAFLVARRSRIGAVVVGEAERWRADVVAVGARRHLGTLEPLGRGVRERILYQSRCPVAVVAVSRPTERMSNDNGTWR